jgi:uncharacterized protein YjbI with pentapeptide repeats
MPDKKSFGTGSAESSPMRVRPRSVRLADDNPWYCLATIQGEQPVDHFNHDLARRNHAVWSRWVGGGLREQGKERAEFERDFAERIGTRSLPLPDPDAVVDFSNTHFVRRVNFLSFLFPRAVNFSAATFSGEANFEQTRFHVKADFTSATFSGDAYFDHAQVNTGDADFQSATFSKGVVFDSVVFQNANFHSVKFCGPADFSRATFNNGATFLSAKFTSDTDFTGAVFNTVANFGSALFFGTASFSATFHKNADFGAAQFISSVQLRREIREKNHLCARAIQTPGPGFSRGEDARGY